MTSEQEIQKLHKKYIEALDREKALECYIEGFKACLDFVMCGEKDKQFANEKYPEGSANRRSFDFGWEEATEYMIK